MPGFFVSGIGPIVCIQSITWSNLADHMLAEPIPGPRPVDAWLMLRVSHAGRRGPGPVIRGPRALDLVAVFVFVLTRCPVFVTR